MGLKNHQKTELQKLESQGLKRFMVGEVQEQVLLRTIYAKTPNDALQLVLGGEGLPAGVEGPTTLFHLAKEIGLGKDYKSGDFTKAFAAMRGQLDQLQQKQEPKIIVPTIVPPTTLVKP